MGRAGQSQQTKIYGTLDKLINLGNSHQKAIEAMQEKIILLAQNVNMLSVRLAVTERLMREKAGVTDEDLERVAVEAMAAAHKQQQEERAAQQPTEESSHLPLPDNTSASDRSDERSVQGQVHSLQ